jgi:hypothetical protein
VLTGWAVNLTAYDVFIALRVSNSGGCAVRSVEILAEAVANYPCISSNGIVAGLTAMPIKPLIRRVNLGTDHSGVRPSPGIRKVFAGDTVVKISILKAIH